MVVGSTHDVWRGRRRCRQRGSAGWAVKADRRCTISSPVRCSPAAAPWHVEVLIISRVLLGLARRRELPTLPLYLSRIAPEKIRGGMISMYQLI